MLTVARDRMGEKPLYWAWCDEVLLFGSELKALKIHLAINVDIDRNALTLLLYPGALQYLSRHSKSDGGAGFMD